MLHTSSTALLESEFKQLESNQKKELASYVKNIYGDIAISECPFTEEERVELSRTNELLIYLPAKLTMQQLCDRFGIKANVNFENETMIRNTMVSEDQWFIASNSKTPELTNETGLVSKRVYNVLHTFTS